jgi:competence protein ComEC
MNRIILWFNHMPFAVWENIPATTYSTILLYGVIIFITGWVMGQNKTAFKLSLFCLSIFMIVTVTEKWKSFRSQKIIIYNVPQHLAIDFISGNSFVFAGDTAVLEPSLYNFHLKPARVALQLDHQPEQVPGLIVKNKFFRFKGINILLIDSSMVFLPLTNKITIEYIILSKNSRVSIPRLLETFTCKQFIFDASNSLWKIGKWKKDLEQLHLPFYSVPEQGAFIIEI